MFKIFLKHIVIFILIFEARLILKKYKPKIIAVTGSVGKTTTKNAICSILQKNFFIRCSEKSFNSHIGVALTILGSQNGWASPIKWVEAFLEGLALVFLRNHYPKILVLEIGTDRPGDIASITRWLSPDTVVVTRFGETPVHVEFFMSREELIKEKLNLVYALKDGGVLVLNADDRDVFALGNNKKGPLITFGLENDALVKASEGSVVYDANGIPEGIQCVVEHEKDTFPLKIIGTIGTHYISVVLAGIGVGISLGMDLKTILDALPNFKIPPGRLRILKGVHNSLLIDDSYNSSPIAVESALKAMSALTISGRKIVVLGDMLELGKYTADAHKKIGSYAAHVAELFITVGPRAKLMDESAYEEGMKVENVKHFDTAEEAGEYLKDKIGAGDVILIKGSQSMRMERTVKLLLRHPETAKELLVRQEAEWEKR